MEEQNDSEEFALRPDPAGRACLGACVIPREQSAAVSVCIPVAFPTLSACRLDRFAPARYRLTKDQRLTTGLHR